MTQLRHSCAGSLLEPRLQPKLLKYLLLSAICLIKNVNGILWKGRRVKGVVLMKYYLSGTDNPLLPPRFFLLYILMPNVARIRVNMAIIMLANKLAYPASSSRK